MELNLIINIIFVIIALLASLVTVTIIILEKLYRNYFFLPINGSQISFIFIAINHLVYGLYKNSEIACQILGSLFYTFFLFSHLSILLLLFYVYNILKGNPNMTVTKSILILTVIWFTSLGINLINIREYKNCRDVISGDYCGFCGISIWKTYNFYIYLLNWIIPLVLGTIFFILYSKYKSKILNKKQKQNNHDYGLNIIYIPVINYILLLITFLVAILSFTKITDNEVVLLLNNNSIYIIPVMNLIFFIKFLRNFTELYDSNFKYFGFLLKNKEDIYKKHQSSSSIFE